MLFADLLSLHLITFLMFLFLLGTFFILVPITFLAADSCLPELHFAICHTAAKSVLTGLLSRCMQYWLKNHCPDQTAGCVVHHENT